jgi:hypothetical protein
MRKSPIDCAQKSANFSTRPSATRVVYVLRLVAQPGVGTIKELRRLLKRLLRSHGLQCVSIEKERKNGND